MPRPRFEKLSPEKREHILEAAAQAFAAYGYAQASLNQILETAGISKGAAYYYFDDKADLYTTAVQHYSQELAQHIDLTPSSLTTDTFWPAITALYHQQFTLYRERPWVLGLVKGGGNMQTLPQTLPMEGPLAEFWQQIQSLLGQLFAQGQTLGLIRTDLPDDLLAVLLMAVDDAHDRWLFGRVEALSDAELKAGAARMCDLLQRLLAPA